ncbi:DUF2508 family protein [Natroniella sp. ANB-PHB2]|uniref:DUF2508 family protein n=1 Tax=Natroniella sp. ANB-PHB2 TaxID=3384444 RepID=UPI0038D45BB3
MDDSSDFKDELTQDLEETQEELTRAKRYFNSVSDPDLIDHAIYLLEATRKKYSYLLKKKKKQLNSDK